MECTVALYASVTVPKRSGHLSCLSPSRLVIMLCAEKMYSLTLSIHLRMKVITHLKVGNPEPLVETLHYLFHEFSSPVRYSGRWDRDWIWVNNHK